MSVAALPRLGACPAPAPPPNPRATVYVAVDRQEKVVRLYYGRAKTFTFMVTDGDLEAAIGHYRAMGYTVVHVV